MRTSLRTTLGYLVLPSVLAACGGGTAPGPGIHVVVSAYPLAFAAERLGGDEVTVTNLTPPGVEPHDLELDAEDLEAIATADVVLLVADGFQPAVEDAAAAEASGTVIDVLEGVPMLPGDGGSTRDPHVWLDPTRFREVVARVATALEDAGVDTATRSAALEADLADLDATMRQDLHGCAGRPLVTTHDAFAYLADAYGLRDEPITGISPEAEPDIARLAALADLIRTEGVTTIFSEPLMPPDVAETLADETGARIATLDPLESLSQALLDTGEDYLTVMRTNARALAEGLGC
jgi:zinc transport system substrate-binding protein